MDSVRLESVNDRLPAIPLYQNVKWDLEQHGCVVRKSEETGECNIQLPEGTTKEEMYPGTIDKRWRIILPDKTELRAIYHYERRRYIVYIVPL